MRIKPPAENEGQVPLGDLCSGSAFLWSGNYYIKSQDEFGVRLSTGECRTFFKEAYVAHLPAAYFSPTGGFDF